MIRAIGLGAVILAWCSCLAQAQVASVTPEKPSQPAQPQPAQTCYFWPNSARDVGRDGTPSSRWKLSVSGMSVRTLDPTVEESLRFLGGDVFSSGIGPADPD